MLSPDGKMLVRGCRSSPHAAAIEVTRFPRIRRLQGVLLLHASIMIRISFCRLWKWVNYLYLFLQYIKVENRFGGHYRQASKSFTFGIVAMLHSISSIHSLREMLKAGWALIQVTKWLRALHSRPQHHHAYLDTEAVSVLVIAEIETIKAFPEFDRVLVRLLVRDFSALLACLQWILRLCFLTAKVTSMRNVVVTYGSASGLRPINSGSWAVIEK